MKRNHDLAGLVRLFMSERGCKLRAAQIHAQKESDDWRAFMARHASNALKAPTSSTLSEDTQAAAQLMAAAIGQASDPFEGRPDELLTREELMVRSHWRLWKANVAAALAAAQSNDPITAAGFSRTAADQLAAYNKARAAQVKADLEARRLVPASEFISFKTLVQRTAALVVNLTEIAARANPGSPKTAAAAIEQWQQERWNPAIQALVNECLGMLPAAA